MRLQLDSTCTKHGLDSLLIIFHFLVLQSSATVLVQNYNPDGAFSFSLSKDTNASVAGHDFYVPPPHKSSAAASFEAFNVASSDLLIPFTVFATAETNITGSVLETLVTNYLEDDIYTSDFLEGVLVAGPEGAILDSSAVEYLAGKDIKHLIVPTSNSPANKSYNQFQADFTISPIDTTGNIAPGPYLGKLTGGGNLSLFRVYGLFPDLQEAFMNSFTLDDSGSYSYVELWNTMQYGAMVAVPSRIYSSVLDKSKYPLAGLRFAVKDLMDVNGILTSGASRAMLRLYSTPANATAPGIQRLIDLGATLVGKTKLTVFAFGAYAYQTDDFSYSWNPRADGYLGLSASSYGSAAAISAYPFLDFTIGSDTLGSVRNPADRAGVYGLRPTWSVINTTSIIPSATSLDTLGFLARSPTLMATIAREWDGESNSALLGNHFTPPKKIIYPSEWFPINSSVGQTVIDTWLANLTAAMNMTIEYQNVSSLFHEHVSMNDTLSSFTSTISSLTTHDNWHLFGSKFVSDYYAKFDRYPEVDHAAFSAWQSAPNYPESSKRFSEQRRSEFENFFNDHVIPFNKDTCTEGFWVYQIADTGGGVPEYRDVLNYDYFPPFKPMRGASVAPYAKLVDVTVPIGQIPYQSVISKREEQLTMTLNFVAHKGCDMVLMAFLEACAEAGYCRDVKTGRTAF